MTINTIPEITPDTYAAIRAYLHCRVIDETMTELCELAAQEVVEENIFHFSEGRNKGERITKGSLCYRLSDSDFIIFQKMKYRKIKEKGYSAPPKKITGIEEWNYSMDWPARKARYDAEDALINATTYIHGMKPEHLTVVSHKQKAIDLIIGLVNSINPSFLLDLKEEAESKAVSA